MKYALKCQRAEAFKLRYRINYLHESNEPRHEKTGFFAYAKTKTQISFAVTAKLTAPLFSLHV